MTTTTENTAPSAAGFRISALIEIALFLVVLLAIDLVFRDGTRYWSVSPHPFWVIVLLVSAQYGTREGVVAALASTLCLLVGNLPAQSGNEDFYGWLYSVAATPLMWLVAAVLLGELRMRHVRERDRLREELANARQREETIADSYDQVRQLKEKLELRIAGQLKASVSTYRAAHAMEKLHPQDIMRGVQELVDSALAPQSFSLYVIDPKEGLTVTLTEGWHNNTELVRNFSPRSAMFQEIVGRKHTLVIANTDHEAILDGQGVIAGPLTDPETGEVLGMLKIESLGFTEMHLSTVETFKAICEWVGMALINARRYQTAREESVLNPESNLLTYGYFQRYRDHIAALAKRVGFDVSVITVTVAHADRLSSDVRAKVARTLAESVNDALRNVDLAFDHQESGESYSIIMPATSVKGARIVTSKIEKDLETRVGKAARAAEFSFTVQALHEHKHAA